MEIGWLVEILKLMLGQNSEDEIWSRFVFELVIRTQPSGLLCLWQCLTSVPPVAIKAPIGCNKLQLIWSTITTFPDLHSGITQARQCQSSSNTPGSPCSRYSAYTLTMALTKIMGRVYQELLPDEPCNIVDIGAHGGDTTLPLTLVARFQWEQHI